MAKWFYVAKSGEKWGKVRKSGEKRRKVGNSVIVPGVDNIMSGVLFVVGVGSGNMKI